MSRRNESYELRVANDRVQRKSARLTAYRQRTTRRRQRRDQCRLLALLTETGVLRSW